jgi:sulfatase maturation enzyme AslB (radical SAM superfamily)
MKLKKFLRKIEKRITFKLSDEVKIKKVEELAITPTMKCCLDCAMCHQKELKHWPNMSYADFRALLFKLKKAKVRKISLVGGEIFVHPDMWKFIELMEKMKFQYDLSSNLFSVPNIERLRKLKGLEMVTTSIDGPREIHNKIRGVKEAFEKTQLNIKKLLSWKINIDVACVVQKANYHYLEELILELCKMGIKSITLLLENTLTKEQQSTNKRFIKRITNLDSNILVSSIKNPLGSLNEEDFKKIKGIVPSLKKIVSQYGANLHLASQFIYPDLLTEESSLKNYTCGIFKGYNMIAYNDCSLPFCGFITFGENYSLLKGKPLSIVNSKEYLKLRKAFKKHGALPMCRLCCALKKK